MQLQPAAACPPGIDLPDGAPSVAAPLFAAVFARIAGAVIALIAHAFLRDPRLAPLIVPLHRRINRTIQRLTAIMALLAAGQLPRPHHGGGHSGKPGAARPAIPRTQAWLVRLLRHKAASLGSQLAHLLARPGVPDLLQSAPTLVRRLRPLCRMLAVPETLLPAAPPRRAAKKAAQVSVPDNPQDNPQQAAAPSSPPPPHPAPTAPPPAPPVFSPPDEPEGEAFSYLLRLFNSS